MNKCLLKPRITYVVLFLHFLGGLLGNFITPSDDLNSSILVEYKYWEVN